MWWRKEHTNDAISRSKTTLFPTNKEDSSCGTLEFVTNSAFIYCTKILKRINNPFLVMSLEAINASILGSA